MGYYTFFTGRLEIELKEQRLHELKVYLSQEFNDKEVILVTDTLLTVDAEWKDSGLMEHVVLFISKHGKLLAGSISCHGEDSKDLWEIYISDDHKPYLREHGSFMTLNRSMRIDKYSKGQKDMKEMEITI